MVKKNIDVYKQNVMANKFYKAVIEYLQTPFFKSVCMHIIYRYDTFSFFLLYIYMYICYNRRRANKKSSWVKRELDAVI